MAYPKTDLRTVATGAGWRFSGSLLLAFTVVVATSLPGVSRAAEIVSGTFLEQGGGASSTDSFSVLYDAASTGSISELVFDLSGSSGAVFDPTGSPFAVSASDPVGFDLGVGFDLISPDLLRLVFTGFDPGEAFSFAVDVDDPQGNSTTGADFAGSILSVTFAGGGAAGTFVVDQVDGNQANVSVLFVVPEPSAVLLVGFGIATLAVWRRRAR